MKRPDPWTRRLVGVVLVAAMVVNHAAWALEPTPTAPCDEPAASEGDGPNAPATDDQPGDGADAESNESDAYQAPTLFPIPLRGSEDEGEGEDEATPAPVRPLPDRETVRATLTTAEREWIMRRTLRVSEAGEGVLRVTRGGRESLNVIEFSREVGEQNRIAAIRGRIAATNGRFALVTGGGALVTVVGFFMLAAGVSAAYGDGLLTDDNDNRSAGGGAMAFGSILTLGGAAVTVVTPFVWAVNRAGSNSISRWYEPETVRSLVNEQNERLYDEVARRRRGGLSSLESDSDSDTAQADTSETPSPTPFVPLRPPTRPPLELRLGLAGAGVGAILTF